ncbi:MAG TPA: penicillin-binding protein 2 [Stellaceae bacterium]|nr:penicillin-binding protein 2 [Stellaceae bacterium]
MKTPPLDDDINPCRPRHFKPAIGTTAQTDGSMKRSLDLSRARLVTTGAAFVAAFFVISLRLVEVTVFARPDVALNHPEMVKPLAFNRADIVDRNGQVLATTIETESLFADTRHITDPHATAVALAKILPDSDERDLETRLKSGKGFIWLRRRLPPTVVNAVNQLGIPGLNFQPEDQRVYPQGNLLAHVVGYTGIDNHGLAGIERSFDAALINSRQPLQLSIDLRLQAILHEEVGKAMDEFQPQGGAGIVMNIKTGEVLAMVSLPDFDPNNMDAAKPTQIFNRATLGVYEMGSVFKLFNTALALDNHKATLMTEFDVTHPIHYAGFTIHDYEPMHHPLSVAEIFMVSSNIGSAKMALESGPAAQKAFLDRLGLLRPATIELPEVGIPHYPNPWTDLSTMTVAFGHGISVSPMQYAVAAAGLVNHGVMVPATFIKPAPGTVPKGIRVATEDTSLQLRKILRLVVTNGTGKMANVPGYMVGGKTGTAEKAGLHGYQHHLLLSSFLGIFPMNDPQFLVLVMLDEPHGTKKTYGFATAGWNAAPTVQRVIARMGPLVDMHPIVETAAMQSELAIAIPDMGKKIAAD